MLDPGQEAPSKILTELPNKVEAYSCEDIDTQPVAWVNLGNNLNSHAEEVKSTTLGAGNWKLQSEEEDKF